MEANELIEKEAAKAYQEWIYIQYAKDITADAFKAGYRIALYNRAHPDTKIGEVNDGS